MKEGLKTFFKRGLRLAGQWAECEHYYNRYAMAYHLSRLFSKQSIDCVIDVGGHQGGYGNFLRTEVGYRGVILSFEPVEGNFLKLQQAAKRDDRWFTHQMALGDRCGRFEMNVMKAGLLNSFLAPEPDGVPDFAKWNVIEKREPVECRTLDSLKEELTRRHGWRNVYLKIDTQGYDFKVMQGAAQTLGQVRGLQTEASIRPLYQGMVPFEKVYAHLQAVGFQATGMYPVARDSFQRLVEFDLVMVREDACVPPAQ